MEKIQILESQLRQIIREEGEKIKKEIVLRATLQKIDQELSALKEVHAGGNMAPGKEGVHAGQKKAVFTKKGTHLVEDETEEMDSEEVPTEVPVDDASPEDVSMETPSEEQAETISKDAIMAALQDLGNKLDLTGTVEFTGDGDEMGGEDNIDLDVDVENGAEDAIGSEEGGEEMGSEEMGSEEGGEEMGSEEDLEEGEEGVDPKTGLPLPPKEWGGIKGGMVGENVDPKKQKLNEERERMRKLAGLIKEGK